METNFCGLTEREANEKLREWLSGNASIRVWKGLEFTDSLDNVRLIESRLSQKQFYEYFELLCRESGVASIIKTSQKLLMLNAATRVRALLTVLNLAPMTRDEEAKEAGERR